MNNQFEVIVIGAGHAGIEAASAAARMHCKTLLVTHSLDTIGQMSCNPAIGGIGKGHLVREIDALGGIMARASDRAGIQFRTLNASKGRAVQATRAQIDRQLYKIAIHKLLNQYPTLTILEQTVTGLIVINSAINGINTAMGVDFHAQQVVVTVGTFLNGKIYIGLESFSGGRAGAPATLKLAGALRNLGLKVGRLKTGTPPRIAKKSINYAELMSQLSDQPLPVFSYFGSATEHPPQLPCYITHTNERTHEIIRANRPFAAFCWHNCWSWATLLPID